MLCLPKTNLKAKTIFFIHEAVIHKVTAYEIYEISLSGFLARNSINKTQILQNKALRRWTGANWLVRNSVLYRDLSIPTITELIGRDSSRYMDSLVAHPNHHVSNLALNNNERRIRIS